MTRPRLVLRGIIAASPVALALAAILSLGTGEVSHESMRPGLRPGDVVLFDRVLPPARGDVVVFADPGGWTDEDDALLITRVVGVAGDRVVCCEVGTGRLIVNGVPIDEGYVLERARPGGVIPFDVRVPDGGVWLVGDNRAASHDSRAELATASRGVVAADDVLGVVRATLPR